MDWSNLQPKVCWDCERKVPTSQIGVIYTFCKHDGASGWILHTPESIPFSPCRDFSAFQEYQLPRLRFRISNNIKQKPFSETPKWDTILTFHPIPLYSLLMLLCFLGLPDAVVMDHIRIGPLK